MRFLLDENISPKTAGYLKELGHEAVHVRDVGLKGAADSEIIGYAKDKGLILITVDRGFGNILDYPPKSHPGIIRLKLKYMPSSIVNSVLRSFLLKVELEEIQGNLVILEEGHYRLRKNP